MEAIMYLGLTLVLYVISCAVGYVGLKRLHEVKGWDAEFIVVIVVFIPFINLMWGIFALIDSFDEDKKEIEYKNYNKFFGLKDHKN